MNNTLLENQVALVTGAGSGIGLETARALARAGAAVVLGDVDQGAVRSAAAGLAAAGHRALGIECNVTDESDVARLVACALDAYGRVDVAFNNAGIQVPLAETADASTEDFDRLMAVNLRGIWLCMKHELRHMRSRGSGVIVNCSSQTGLVGAAGLGAYSASKHAVIGLTRTAALEYAAQGIRVNAICPGATNTPMVKRAMEEGRESLKTVMRETPMGRLASVEEIASTVVWLCGPGAGFVTGQAVAVDGGFTAR